MDTIEETMQWQEEKNLGANDADFLRYLTSAEGITVIFSDNATVAAIEWVMGDLQARFWNDYLQMLADNENAFLEIEKELRR